MGGETACATLASRDTRYGAVAGLLGLAGFASLFLLLRIRSARRSHGEADR